MCTHVYIHMCVCVIIILAKVLASPLTREVLPSAGVVQLSLELDAM